MSRAGYFSAGLLLCAIAPAMVAQDLHITIPRRSQLTPVQKLNREGVEAVNKRKYEKAEGLFYKAYLFDPADPFTLNNLGYVSELQGQVDRAEKFYAEATEQECNAIIDQTSQKDLKGRPMLEALGGMKNVPMQINRINVVGTQLLLKERGFEAIAVFNQALKLDPNNAFTLNNLGVANESVGNWPEAMRDYQAAAATKSQAPVVISAKVGSRGKPVSTLAAKSAQDLQKRMDKRTPEQIEATMLTVRGVYATNQNDWTEAKKDFVQAAAVDPQNAFTLNNLGYVAERDGDLETAKEYYARALRADDAGGRIGVSTDASAYGRQLSSIADESQRGVNSEMEAYSERRRRQAPVLLQRRHPDEAAPAAPAPATPAPATPAPATPAATANPAQPQ